MAFSLVGVGSTANDGTGDALRTAFQTINANFTAINNGTQPGAFTTLTASGGINSTGSFATFAMLGSGGATDENRTFFQMRPDGVFFLGASETDAGVFGATLQRANRNGTAWDWWSLDINGSSAIYVDAARNVGIGTTSPAGKLDVRAATGAELFRLYDASTGAHLTAKTYDSGGGVRGVALGYSNDGSAASDLFYLRSAGLGIGTSAPASLLDVNGNARFRSGVIALHSSASYAAEPFMSGIFKSSLTNASPDVLIVDQDNSNTRAALHVQGAGGSVTTLFAASNGSVGIGTTSPDDPLHVNGNIRVGAFNGTAGSGTDDGVWLAPDGRISASRTGNIGSLRRRSTDGDIVAFFRDTTLVGRISVTTTATAYNTSSDERLKENFAPAGDALAVLNAIPVEAYDWKADSSHSPFGYVAQRLNPHAPYAVTQGETPDEMWAVDHSKMVPVLHRAIQQLDARVAQLEGA